MPKAAPYQTVSVPSVAGGLNVADAPLLMRDDETSICENVVFVGAGRATSRRGLQLGPITGGVDENVVGIFPFEYGSTGAVVIVYDSGSDLCNLYTLSSDADDLTLVGTMAGYASGVVARPTFTATTLNEQLFVCDEGRQFGLTVYAPAEASPLFQPTFDFDGNASFVAAKPRVVAAYNNMVFMAGYGSDSDQNRPEIVRFSYPGMFADAGGGGDAGDPTGYFATDDYFMVGTRGVPVTAMGAARGRLLICNPFQTYILFGFDRNSFNLELLDNERGCVNARSMIEADGELFWWGPRGPVKWSGGVVEDISAKIAPIVEDAATSTIFAVHSQATNQVRWYYSSKSDPDDGDGSGAFLDPRRAICYDYRRGIWTQVKHGDGDDLGSGLPVRVRCGGVVRPTSTQAPLAAPTIQTNLTGQDWAETIWLNGDVAVETITKIERSLDGVDFSVVGTLTSGASKYRHSNLEPGTDYYVRARHFRNGTASAYSATASFTTLAEGLIRRPENFTVEDSPYWDTKYSRVRPAVLLSWIPEYTEYSTLVYRSTVSGFTPDSSTLWGEVSSGKTTLLDRSVDSGTEYFYVIRSKDSNGVTSNLTDEVAVTPTLVGDRFA